jgi:serine protease
VPVVVAVVDTGVFLDHEDLRTRLLSGYDFVRMRPGGDDPGDSRRRGESSWHGTHVAGIAAATTDNGIGIAGVSWGAEILPVRVLGEGGGTVYTVLQGVRWAAGLENDSGTVPTRPADVINLSLGGGGFAPAEQALFQEIAARGILVVAAAGNSASEVTFPAAYEGVFAVGATDAGAERAYYSSGGDLLDLVAPGGDLRFDRTGDGYPDGILSSVVDDLSGTRRSAYGFKQGTSMAAPMVSGVFALARSLNASLDANALRGLLEAGRLADDLGPPGWDRATGWGQINAARMVEAVVQDGSLPPPPPSVSVLPRSLEFGFTLSSLEFVLRAGLGGGARVLEIQGSAPWLEVAPTAVDALGLGAYRATLRRDALADGTYASALTVRFEGLPDLVIPVSAQVVTPDLASDSVGRIYVLLEDARGIPLAERALEPENGRYRFRFEGVAPGRYRLFGGSDMNGDFFICDPGEACGAYPTISLLEWFEVDGDRSDLDFSVGFRPFARSALEASVDRVAPRSRSGFGVEVPPRRVAR